MWIISSKFGVLSKKSLLRILLCGLLFIIFELLTPNSELQCAKLTVPGDVTTQTLILDPRASAPASVNEGQIYYDDTANQPKYYDGNLPWKSFEGKDKTVATKIVAASNSLDSVLDSDRVTKCPGDGSMCYSPRADYTCDGTADQTTIQKAIDALGSNPGVVYLLEGTYNLTGTPSVTPRLDDGSSDDINDSGKAIIGAGKGTVLKIVSNIDYVNGIRGSSVSNILISNLMIDGNKTVVSGAHAGIDFYSVSNSKIDKVWVENMDNEGIELSSSSNNIISNCFLNNNGWPGIAVYANCNNNLILNNIILNNTGPSILIETESAASINNVISGNTIRNSTQGIFLLYNVNNNIVVGNNIAGVTNRGICLNYGSSNNTILGNSVYNNGTYGIILDSGGDPNSYNTISGNNLSEGGDADWDGIFVFGNSNDISGNVIYNYKRHGLRLSGSNNIISSNRIRRTTASTNYAIYIESGSGNYIFGNHTTATGDGSWLGEIKDSGEKTKYTDKTKITLEPGGGYTGLVEDGRLTPTGPTSYLRLNPTASITLNTTTAIAGGKSAGDLLILENINSTNTITIPDNAATRLNNSTQKQLSWGEMLVLIWDNDVADTCCWVQIGGKQ